MKFDFSELQSQKVTFTKTTCNDLFSQKFTHLKINRVICVRRENLLLSHNISIKGHNFCLKPSKVKKNNNFTQT